MGYEKKCDLHVHTVLSPCGDDKMLPGMIVTEAKNKKMDCLGITDHNSTENIQSVRKVAEKFGIDVLGGIEITSKEEVHMLAFFDDEIAIKNMHDIIYQNLEGENDENVFGKQNIVDEFDNTIGYNKKLLIGATELGVAEIVSIVHSLSGIIFASHVDRESFSILSQLGFIPEGLSFDGLEISSNSTNEDFLKKFPEYKKFPIVSFSDAHFLEDIGKVCTVFKVDKISVKEIKKVITDGGYFITYS